MKWIIGALAVAAVLIAMGIGLTGSRDASRLSDVPEAVELCDEGTEDLHAFRLGDAVDKLGRALELDPGLAEASIARAMAFARLGRRHEYKRELARADSLTALIETDRRRLLAQLRLGDFAASRFFAMRDSVLGRLKDEAPDNIFVLVAEAAASQRAGDDAETERTWRRILEQDPNYANSYNMLGYMELARGNYEKAIDYMQKYAFLAPDLANPHDSLGEVLMVLGRYEEAEAEFRAAVTKQPDFYVSLLNLGRTYLARGQLKTGLGILEKVRNQVKGSEIEMRVDREIVSTFLVAGLEHKLAEASADYVARYPEDGISGLYRAVSLAYRDRYDESRAVMDSCIAAWTAEIDQGAAYKKDSKRNIDSALHQYQGIVADLRDEHRAAATAWAAAIEDRAEDAAAHELWYFRYRLASALHELGEQRRALEIADAMLAVNPRIINTLILKVRCHLALQEGAEARAALEQLQWSLSQADADYPARAVADELATRVSALAAR